MLGFSLKGCFTTGEGDSESLPCIFPFEYNGVRYNGCAAEGHDEPWCYTNLDSKNWGNCNEGCPIDDGSVIETVTEAVTEADTTKAFGKTTNCCFALPLFFSTKDTDRHLFVCIS